MIPKVTQDSSFIDVNNIGFYASASGNQYNYLQTSNSIFRLDKDQTIQDVTQLSFQYVNFNDEICNRIAVDSNEIFSV